MIALPGVCMGCRLPVTWNGYIWIDADQRPRQHHCDRFCREWMPNARAFCARPLGHSRECRTWAALDSERRAKRAAA